MRGRLPLKFLGAVLLIALFWFAIMFMYIDDLMSDNDKGHSKSRESKVKDILDKVITEKKITFSPFMHEKWKRSRIKKQLSRKKRGRKFPTTTFSDFELDGRDDFNQYVDMLAKEREWNKTRLKTKAKDTSIKDTHSSILPSSQDSPQKTDRKNLKRQAIKNKSAKLRHKGKVKKQSGTSSTVDSDLKHEDNQGSKDVHLKPGSLLKNITAVVSKVKYFLSIWLLFYYYSIGGGVVQA